MKHKIILFAITILVFSCSKPEPRKPITRKSSTFLSESIKRNKVMNKMEEEVFLEIMKNDSLHQYISSTSGFWYTYLTKDSTSSKLPVKGDEVVYSYSIKDINNNVLYTDVELGDRRYLVDKQELISGLQDGLKLMKEGEEVLFLFPSYKAYGYSGYKKISSNQPLIYTVKLKEIRTPN